LSRTPGKVTRGAPQRGQGGAAALAEWGFDDATIARFRADGAQMTSQ
jgi:alpha-methylacyl-CoA racemase